MGNFNILELNHNSHIHFIGIGGVSMSGLAQILQNLGYKVSGSDMKESNNTKKLSDSGIKVYIGHNSLNLKGTDVVVFTAAVKGDNPEMIEAKKSNLHIVERSTLLGQLMKKYKYSLGIAGTHGKTTTTSMVSLMFLEANLDPTITVGGDLDQIGGNLKIGNSDYFITEACEYVESFLEFFPYLAIILNIDADHLDYYRDIEHINEAFQKYANLIPKNGFLVANYDDIRVKKIAGEVPCNTLTYSLINANANYFADNINFDNFGYANFDVYYNNKPLGNIKTSVRGIHNVSNSLAAIASSMAFGIDFKTCAMALSKFVGAKRRFEYKGTFNDITVIDDYAHHPTEVKATFSAAQKYPHNKVWCVFQPHTYTRMKALLNEFEESFDDVDKIIVTDIYAAREKNPGDIHSKDLVKRLVLKGKDAIYIETFEQIKEYLINNANPKDLIVTMGAGDIYTIGEDLINQ